MKNEAHSVEILENYRKRNECEHNMCEQQALKCIQMIQIINLILENLIKKITK